VTALEITGLKPGEYKVQLNGDKARTFTDEQLKNLKIQIGPDGTIQI
jgi:hypothetical protein